MKYELPLIIYDAECPLCVRFMQGLKFLDKSIHFVSLQEDDVYSQFPELTREKCEEKVHLVTVDRSILAGPEVLEHLAKTLPGVRKLAWLLENDKGKKVVDFFYQKVDELRENVKRKEEECDKCPNKF